MQTPLYKIYLTCILLVCFRIVFSMETCEQYELQMENLVKGQCSIEEAKSIYEQYSELDCKDILLAYNFLGFAYYNNSKFRQAKEFLLYGENEFLRNGVGYEQFAINQMYTALILIVEKDFKSADYHLQKAEKYAKSIENKYVLSSIFQNMALAKLGLGQLDEAESYINKSIDTNALDSISLAYAYQNLTNIYYERGDMPKTKEYLQLTKSYWDKLDRHPKGKYLLSFLEAKNAIAEKKFEEALDYLIEGRTNIKKENRLLLGENYLIEAQIQDSLGNDQAKLNALKNAIIESSDLTKSQLSKTIQELSELQDSKETNVVLSELISKLKEQSFNQRKMDIARNKLVDIEIEDNKSLIKSQINYLIALVCLLILLTFLLFRLRKQRSDILYLNQSLKQKNNELNQFAQIASHDLKSPLNTIISFVNLLKKEQDPKKANHYLEIITKSSINMVQMISDLLNFSTLGEKLKLQDVNLKELIEETLIKNQSIINQSSAEVEIHKSCNLDFECDKTLIANVIQNLISNAINYCQPGIPPKIEIKASKENQMIYIDFKDNGIGVKEEDKDSIFEMFKRLKVNDAKGTGIGLSICKKVIEKHGGKISLRPAPESGSIFTLVLPLRQKKHLK